MTLSRRASLALLSTMIAATLLAGAVAAVPARASSSGVSALGVGELSSGEPVPSLEPRATDRLWRELTRRAQPLSFSTRQAECRPARILFYAPTDWLRLATMLAANASPCAEYYVSVPPLTSDKTRPRPNQANLIRALGPRFHALAEIHMNGWRGWVSANGASWHDAGVEARRRMAAAGYDAALGDTWAVNELSSAVRRGAGAARAEARDFVRGLFEGDGSVPQARGVVWIVGVAQNVPDLRDYRARLQTWMLEQDFWVDMNAFVSDWSLEAYGDARLFGVPEAGLAERRDALNDYLQHQLALARKAPPEAGAARTYLDRAYSPLANAAWQWDASFGNTAVPVDVMQSYVSTQVYAMRSYAARSGDVDRFGFAWAPRNLDGALPGVFARQARDLLDRLATAIRDSGEIVDPADPGVQACGPIGSNLWCAANVDGARASTVWKSFATWVQASLAFTTAPQTLPAGTASGAITLQLQQGRFAVLPDADVVVTVSSDSPRGELALSPEGPWAPTLTVTIPAGASGSPELFYRDTRAGTSVLTASAAGYATATQAETILGGPPVGVAIEPETVTVVAGSSQELTVSGIDAFGNAVPVTDATWTLAPGTPGSLSSTTGRTVTFTATAPGSGSIAVGVETASGPLTSVVEVTVTPQPGVRVASVTYRRVGPRLRVDVAVVDADGKAVPRATVRVLVRRNGGRHLVAARRTGTRGKTAFRPAARPGCFTTRITRVSAPARRWNGKTPSNRFCIQPKRPKRSTG